MKIGDEAHRAMSIEDQEARRDQFIEDTPLPHTLEK